MNLTRLFLVQMTPASRSIALAAARVAFPEADTVEVNSVDEAAQSGGTRRAELLVLGEPDTASVAQAIQATDASGLPRWAVVILGRYSSDLAEAVPPEEWNPPLVARVFRSALLQHELLYENLRLQGDLRTVARRISHDLCTPVGCIYTSAHVLELLPANDAASIATMIENLKVSSNEITRLIERIGFVLRASADPGVPARVGMQGVIGVVLQQLEPEIQRTGGSVVQASSWPEVTGVPQWLQVIWWNLLDNALKHGGPGAQVQLAWRLDHEEGRFSVIDRGAGVAPSHQAGLFRPLDQLHQLLVPGLGLSIVQRLVALQGGRCGYERRDDGSSVFFFTLPAAHVSLPPQGCTPVDLLPAFPPKAASTGSSTANHGEIAGRPSLPAGPDRKVSIRSNHAGGFQ
jgi:signal transduction histidine kinase